MVLALIAIALAWWVFVADPAPAHAPACAPPPAAQLLQDQYRFDEVYEEAVVQPGRDLGDVLTTRRRALRRAGRRSRAPSRALIDAGARPARSPQTGLVRAYAFAMIAGVAILGAVFALAMR